LLGASKLQQMSVGRLPWVFDRRRKKQDVVIIHEKCGLATFAYFICLLPASMGRCAKIQSGLRETDYFFSSPVSSQSTDLPIVADVPSLLPVARHCRHPSHINLMQSWPPASPSLLLLPQPVHSSSTAQRGCTNGLTTRMEP
jgi:hypothetical protein